MANTRKNFVSDYPMLVYPKLAELYGVDAAAILGQVHYWTEINRKSGKNYKSGYYWTYNSYESWAGQFRWMSKDTIKRNIRFLEQNGILISGVFNKKAYDRTKWYRLDYNKISELEPDFKNCEIIRNDGKQKQRERSKLSQRVRYEVMKRDGFRCKICGRTAEDGVKLHVDHIIPIAKGGKTELANLQTLCEDCNLGKGTDL